jgi:predicted Zn-dependent protease
MSLDETQQEHFYQLSAGGARLLAHNHPKEALPLLMEAWNLNPRDVPVAINLGSAYILLGKHDKAVPYLEAAAQNEPENPMVWTNLAAAQLGKPHLTTPEGENRAIASFERALSLDPHVPQVHYNLGLIYLGRNDLVQAAHFFALALESDPNDRDARRYLDRLHANGVEPR